MEEETEAHPRTHRQHPIPQHIGAFQFKLVGAFTLKQFGYFASFGFLAWLVLASKLFLLVKFPIAAFLLSLGVAFAFIPVAGRPFDKMLLNFFKAIISPTQRIWIKKGETPEFFKPEFGKPKVAEPVIKTKTSRKILKEYLLQFTPKTTQADLAETAFLAKLDFGISLPAEVAIATREVPKEKPAAEETLAGITVEERKPQKEAPIPIASIINLAERPVITVPTPTLGPSFFPSIGEVKVRKLKSKPASPFENSSAKIKGEKKFEVSPQLKIMLGLGRVDGEGKTAWEERQRKLGGRVVGKSPKISREKTQREKFVQTKVIKPPQASSPTQPNLISGVVKDVKGHLLEGVILIVKNENGAPVRALKTNLLGQFSISTPLPNNHYTIHLEKEGDKFSIIEFEAKGKILQPFEIVAKG